MPSCNESKEQNSGSKTFLDPIMDWYIKLQAASPDPQSQPLSSTMIIVGSNEKSLCEYVLSQHKQIQYASIDLHRDLHCMSKVDGIRCLGTIALGLLLRFASWKELILRSREFGSQRLS